MMKKSLLFAVSLCLLNACHSGESQIAASSAPAATPASSTEKQAHYRVYTEQSYLPFIAHDGSKVSGFEHDILDEISKRQGFTVSYTPYVWEGLFDTLNSGKADIVSSGITITDERQKIMAFTDPHFETETVLLTHKKNADIKKFADIRNKKIAIQKGTLQSRIVEEYQGIPVFAETSWLSVKSTIKHDSDATLGDLGLFKYFVKTYESEGLTVIQDPHSPKEQLGFGVKKDNVELQNKLNQGLKQIKADGTYQQIYQKWFGQ